MKKIRPAVITMIGLLTGSISQAAAESFEYGAATGIGEPFGRAGLSLQIQEGTWAAAVAKHFAWNDFTLSLSNEVFALGKNHGITLGIAFGYNAENRESDSYRERVCVGLYDTHDFGNPSGFRAYYGFQLLRYFVDAGDFAIVIPILGLGYSFEL